MPKGDQEFDPNKHEKTVHTKGPLKGKETWARKTAIQSDREAGAIAERRNLVKEKKSSWLRKLFGIKKETYLDTLTEEGLEEEMQRSPFTFEVSKENSSYHTITGKINGHKIQMDVHIHLDGTLTLKNNEVVFVDDEKIADEDAGMIAEKFLPLLSQWRKNQIQIKKLGVENKTELSKKDRAVMEVLGKLQPKKAPELEGTDEQKQLGPKKEE